MLLVTVREFLKLSNLCGVSFSRSKLSWDSRAKDAILCYICLESYATFVSWLLILQKHDAIVTEADYACTVSFCMKNLW